jgi:hypothetical protein
MISVEPTVSATLIAYRTPRLPATEQYPIRLLAILEDCAQRCACHGSTPDLLVG